MIVDRNSTSKASNKLTKGSRNKSQVYENSLQQKYIISIGFIHINDP